MAKKNPLKLNALQLKTLAILQQMARSPEHAQHGDEEGSMLVTNFPAAHGNHFHVGDAVVLTRDASGLANARVFVVLERTGLLRSLSHLGAMYTAEAHTTDPRLADPHQHISVEGQVGEETVS